MKRIFLIVLCVACMQFVCGQEVLVLPYEANSLTEEQKAMNPERLAYPTELKETIQNEVSFECTPQVEESGLFSVSATKQVIFSPGNLQFNAMQGTHQCADGTSQKGTWRFAEHQWDYVGDAENGTVYENGTKCNNAKVNATYTGWIDFFCWGTSGWKESGANAYKPYETSQSYEDYYPGGQSNTDLTGTYAYADWGMYNQIGEDPAGTWRTLTSEEWVYLSHGRKDAEKLFGFGMVNGVPGMIILPDDWKTPSDVTFTPSIDKGMVYGDGDYKNSNEDNFTHNTYTSVQWDKMESGGAVFLPAAGVRHGAAVDHASTNGHYWSSTHNSLTYAYSFNFGTGYLRQQGTSYRYNGFSVRLVSDVK